MFICISVETFSWNEEMVKKLDKRNKMEKRNKNKNTLDEQNDKERERERMEEG